MTEPDPAMRHFMIFEPHPPERVAMAFLGVAIIAKRLVEPAEIVGGILMFIAAIDVIVVPIILAKRWRTPK